MAETGISPKKSLRGRLGGGGIARAFSSRNFRIFWLGLISYNLGVWINRLAIGWLTWELTHSTTWLGLIGAASMLPMIIFGPISGTTADRLGHRFQLVTATVIGGMFTCVTATLVLTGLITPHLLFALVLCGGTTRSFTVPARNALVHALVDEKTLSAAIAVNAATYQGSRFIGPAVGGFFLALGGVGLALFAYAGAAFFTATLLIFLNIRGEGGRSRQRGGFFSELADGFRYTYAHRGIRAVMMMTAASTLFMEPYFEMLPAFADRVFALGEEGLAQLMAATGAGAMLGGLWLAQRGRAEGLTRILATGLITAAMGLLVLASSKIYAVALGALFVTGFSLVIASISIQSLIQHAVASELRARVISLNGMLFVAGPALGAILIGWAAERLGLGLSMSVSICLGIVLWLAALRSIFRNRGELEGQ